MTVFAALSTEVDFLIKEGENKYCWGLLLYGEKTGNDSQDGSGGNLLLMGKFISFLQASDFEAL